MNLSYTRGDDEASVDENFRRIGQAIGFDEKKLVFSNQIHDTMIRRVGKEDCGKVMTGMDGLVTDVPGVPLYTGYADCVPLFFFDPVKKSGGSGPFRLEGYSRTDRRKDGKTDERRIWMPS